MGEIVPTEIAGSDFYKRLRTRVKDWQRTKTRLVKPLGYFFIGMDFFHLIARLVLDKRVPPREKAKLVAMLFYFVSPVDIVPELLLGPVALADDLALTALVLNSVIVNTGPEIIDEHWAGDEEVLHLIKKSLTVADNLIGAGMWKKIKNIIKE